MEYPRPPERLVRARRRTLHDASYGLTGLPGRISDGTGWGNGSVGVGTSGVGIVICPGRPLAISCNPLRGSDSDPGAVVPGVACGEGCAVFWAPGAEDSGEGDPGTFVSRVGIGTGSWRVPCCCGALPPDPGVSCETTDPTTAPKCSIVPGMPPSDAAAAVAPAAREAATARAAMPARRLRRRRAASSSTGVAAARASGVVAATGAAATPAGAIKACTAAAGCGRVLARARSSSSSVRISYASSSPASASRRSTPCSPKDADFSLMMCHSLVVHVLSVHSMPCAATASRLLGTCP